jgi:hypothetical protein
MLIRSQLFMVIVAGVMFSVLAGGSASASQSDKKQCLSQGAHCGAIKAGATQCCPGSICQGPPRNMYCK